MIVDLFDQLAGHSADTRHWNLELTSEFKSAGRMCAGSHFVANTGQTLTEPIRLLLGEKAGRRKFHS